MTLTDKEEKDLRDIMENEELEFKYDEFYAMQPEIFEAIEDGDFERMQKMLNEIGGFQYGYYRK